MIDFLNSNSVSPEFVGADEVGDTIGLCIPSVDSQLLEKLHVKKKYTVLGILGDRTGGGPQLFSMDEGIKATNTECIDVEWTNDTKGGGGQGCMIVIGGYDPSDVRQAIEVTFKNLRRFFGDVYNNQAGHIELQYTARAAGCLSEGLGAEEGKAFGILNGCPAPIGVVMADTALKTAGVKPISLSTPSHNGSPSNETVLTISGDSGAVRQAIIAGRERGIDLLGQMGDKPVNDYPSYIH
ncbi:MAG: propanediol utilization microcompartment protein PduB [Lentilactobacillus diolivorans]|jgi:microcompartment protein PduB|uniref:propanediol utilization microcompartment protein PduB n=1 Tax=Lentilactobacillus diolivorans TaxID=179838 RepID=UPI000FF7E426|nr:propanediol utilization microcompartment protein PduB [Lentilactobacillus diolivorans]MCH4165296.1 propanediol utilization microcompartment protein PduB [Lentilactobacillus diolivorans]MDH5106527.1 propanediol utilization microcompartment protein PduB [Lentilactobacillus diolivorans]RRG03132.1 MAG: propanediol utilization microcompartment protein PduB [Lactobacillus sp.]